MEAYQRENGNWLANESDSTGRVILGIGATEQQSMDDCRARVEKRTSFLSLSPRAQLIILTDTKKSLLSQELSDSVKLIAQLILEK